MERSRTSGRQRRGDPERSRTPGGCRSPPTAPSRQRPRMVARAKDMHYYTPEGRPILDGAAGPVVLQRRPQPRPDRRGDPGAGGRARLRARLPVRPPAGLRRSPRRIAELAPGDLDHVFFCNSGSEAVDTALKIALAYWQRHGPGPAHAPDRPRARLSRRRLRRHLGRRHRRQPQVLRLAAGRRRPPAAHLQPRGAGLLARASPNGARISPTSSSASSRCTTPRPSPP